jgi:hypothetical protein
MTRALFLAGVAAAALAVTSLGLSARRGRAGARGQVAGRCANQRHRLRWSGYSAADFT